MANKFHIIISSAEQTNADPVYSYPTFTDVAGSSNIPDGGYASSAWITGATVFNTSTETPLANGKYTYDDGTLRSFEVNDGTIISMGRPCDGAAYEYASCEDFFANASSGTYYSNSLLEPITFYSSQYGLDSEKLDGVYSFHPYEYTFNEGLIVGDPARICPYDYPYYANCEDAANGSPVIGTLYSSSSPYNLEIGLTSFYTDIGLTTTAGALNTHIHASNARYISTSSLGILAENVECATGTAYLVYNTFQDYFDAIGEYDVFIAQSDTLTIGTVVYTNVYMTNPASDFVYNGLHYVLTDGEIMDINDYGVAPFSNVYSDCISTPFGPTLYFRSDGLLEPTNTVWLSVGGLDPGSWTVLSYSSFVYDFKTFSTNGSGQVIDSIPCSS